MPSLRSFTGGVLPSFALLLAACSGAGTQPGPRDPRGEEQAGAWNPQGNELLAAPRALEPFSVTTSGWQLRGTPLARLSVVDGELRLPGRPASALIGATFVATAPDHKPVAMRIARVQSHENVWKGPPSKVRFDYVIEYQDAASGAWSKLCPDGYPGATLIPGTFEPAAPVFRPTPNGTFEPVALMGSRSNGKYLPSADQFTFSCREGVAAKCVDWGYAPWPESAGLVPYFQACTRMARADYCGNGQSRTVEGTMINYGDLREPPIVRFVPQRGFVPEAVWGRGDGARGKPAAVCLSRTRWSTMPLGPRSPCADLMPDPREDTAGPRAFCDDMTLADWNSAGALFVNSSRTMDVGLFQWTDGAGHYVTTTRFAWLGKDVGGSGPPGYPQFVSIEGATYKPTSRVPAIRGLVPLFRYTKRVGSTQLSLTSTAPRDGFADGVLEGYVFGPSAEPPVQTAQPLVLHGDGRGGFATTTSATPPAGYTKLAELGWVPH